MVGHECVLEIEANIYNVGVWTCISKNGKATDYHVDLHLGNEIEVLKEKFVPSLPIQTNEVQELFNMAEALKGTQGNEVPDPGQLNLGKIVLGDFKARLAAKELEVVRLRNQIQSLESKLEDEKNKFSE